MTNHTQSSEEMREKIEKEIDFMCDHWFKDDKPPYSFGGWRGEVVASLVSIMAVQVASAREEERKRIKAEVQRYIEAYHYDPYKVGIYREVLALITPTNNSEKKCTGNCPNVCKVHMGEFDFCSNPGCLCHLPL